MHLQLVVWTLCPTNANSSESRNTLKTKNKLPRRKAVAVRLSEKNKAGSHSGKGTNALRIITTSWSRYFIFILKGYVSISQNVTSKHYLNM